MDAGEKKGGRKEWDDAFKDNVDEEKPDFDEAYEGKLKLTQEQADQLFNHNLNVRIDKIKNIYSESWDKLRANERIAIVSAYFNGRKLVDSSTKFYEHITAYVKTGDKKDLSKAVNEIQSRSNPNKDNGVQNRRDYDSNMLDSIKAPFYSPPNSPLISNTKMKITVGKTIVPIGMNRFFLQHANSEYFIWRTRLDDRVRVDHFKKEGRVFRKKDYYDNSGNFIGEGYNCRCKAEDPTVNLIFQEDAPSQKAIGHFLRFGGGRSIMIF